MTITPNDNAAIRLIVKIPLKNNPSITIRQYNVGILNTVNRSNFKLLCIIHKTLLYNIPVYFRD